jgi:hypothetical protein
MKTAEQIAAELVRVERAANGTVVSVVFGGVEREALASVAFGEFLRTAVAGAIHEAVAAERERWAGVADHEFAKHRERAATHLAAERPECTTLADEAAWAADEIARRIRGGE